jgi:intergrase/recombinase
MVPETNRELNNLIRASSSIADNEAETEEELLERFDMLFNVETRLLKQIKDETEVDRSAAEDLLRQIQRLPKSQQDAAKNIEKNIRSLLEFDKQHGTLKRR